MKQWKLKEAEIASLTIVNATDKLGRPIQKYHLREVIAAADEACGKKSKISLWLKEKLDEELMKLAPDLVEEARAEVKNSSAAEKDLSTRQDRLAALEKTINAGDKENEAHLTVSKAPT